MITLLDTESVVVLSPHLDDAALSCGALLAERTARGRSTTVVTVFNGPPDGGMLSDAAREFHLRCGHGDDAMALRQKEDDAALKVVGARPVRLSLPEALYRRDSEGRPLYPKGPDINAGDPANEPELVDRVVELLDGLPELQAADVVIAPLSIGDHIDHQVVAAAARNIARKPALWWYEDTPYLLYEHCAGWVEKLRPHGAQRIRFGESAWAAKLAAIACYDSQRQILWYRPDGWQSDLTAYVIEAYGTTAERYWRLHYLPV